MTLVLARQFVVAVHACVKPFLFGIEYDELAELLVHLFPHVVLGVRDYGPGLFRGGVQPPQPGQVLFLRKLLIELVQSKEVPLVVWTDGQLVLDDGDSHMPHVQVLSKVLEDFRLQSHLGRNVGYSFE